MDWFRLYLAVLTVATVAIAPFPLGLLLIDAPLQPTRFTVTGYDREAHFGTWVPVAGTQCTSRELALADAWSAQCDMPYAHWDAAPISDPYTGDPLLPADVELDHLYPLSAAWDMGAHSWNQEKRVAFANDPLNLIVTSSKANQAKSDMLPAEWMPPAWRAHCAYSRRLGAVAEKYGLPLTRDDYRVMRRSCSGARGLVSAREL